MSSQLNAEWSNWLRVSSALALSRGHLWVWTYAQNLLSGGVDFVSMTVGDKPAMIAAMELQTTGTRGVALEIFKGGSISIGTPRNGQPLNFHTPKPSPWAYEEGGSIDVPGALLVRLVLGEGLSGSIGDRGHPVAVLEPSQFYYMTIENLHNQAADISLDIEAAAIHGIL